MVSISSSSPNTAFDVIWIVSKTEIKEEMSRDVLANGRKMVGKNVGIQFNLYAGNLYIILQPRKHIRENVAYADWN